MTKAERVCNSKISPAAWRRGQDRRSCSDLSIASVAAATRKAISVEASESDRKIGEDVSHHGCSASDNRALRTACGSARSVRACALALPTSWVAPV